MQIVSRAEYLRFLAGEGGIEEVAQERVTGIIQSMDPHSQVRAQVLYFEHSDTPQYMIDERAAWPGGKKPAAPERKGTRAPRSLEDAATGTAQR